ncbi:MAG TPA: hypothetical protein VFW09_02625 [Solirubrobacteraceae bacterium]|nr:hypothetical protein [Solirubrobacteraceae bacterium]
MAGDLPQALRYAGADQLVHVFAGCERQVHLHSGSGVAFGKADFDCERHIRDRLSVWTGERVGEFQRRRRLDDRDAPLACIVPFGPVMMYVALPPGVRSCVSKIGG